MFPAVQNWGHNFVGLWHPVPFRSYLLASFTRYAIPPFVNDENPGRETQDKNGVDGDVKRLAHSIR